MRHFTYKIENHEGGYCIVRYERGARSKMATYKTREKAETALEWFRERHSTDANGAG